MPKRNLSGGGSFLGVLAVLRHGKWTSEANGKIAIHCNISVTYMREWNLSRLKGQSNSLWFAMVITGMDCACHWMPKKKALCFTNLSEFWTSLHFWKRFRGDHAVGGSFHRGLLPWRAGFLTWMLWYYDFLHWMFPMACKQAICFPFFFDNHICWNQAWFTFYIYNQVVLPNSCVYIGWPFLSRNLNCVVASPWHI